MPNRFAKPASAKYWASKKTVDGHRGQIREIKGRKFQFASREARHSTFPLTYLGPAETQAAAGSSHSRQKAAAACATKTESAG